MVKTIIKKKLAHMQVKRTQKAVKYKLAHKSEMSFAQFLEFVDEEQIISKMMSRYSGNQNKSVANAKVSVASAGVIAKKEGPTGNYGISLIFFCIFCTFVNSIIPFFLPLVFTIFRLVLIIWLSGCFFLPVSQKS